MVKGLLSISDDVYNLISRPPLTLCHLQYKENSEESLGTRLADEI